MQCPDESRIADFVSRALPATAAAQIEAHHLPDALSSIADARNNLAAVLQRLGKFEESQREFEASAELYRKVYGEEHPEVFATYTNLGFLLIDRDMPREALAYLEKARAIGERTVGRDHVNVGITLDTMGLAHVSLGDYAKAAELHREAHRILLAKLGPKHPRTGFAVGNLGRAAQRLGDLPAAIKAYRESADILRAALGPTHDIVGRVQVGLAVTLRIAGDDKAAREELLAAIKIFDGNGASGADDARSAFINLGEIDLARGKVADARKSFARAMEGVTDASNRPALMGRAGLVFCDAVERKVDRARLTELEDAIAKIKAEDLEPHLRAFIDFARALAYAALGDRARAREVGAASRDGYATAKLDAQRARVDRWLAGLR